MTSGQRVPTEAASRARASASAGASESPSAAGAPRPYRPAPSLEPPREFLAELIAAEIRERWHDRVWYRRRRDIAASTARSYEGALDRSGHWQELIDENDRELRTLLRVLRKARR